MIPKTILDIDLNNIEHHTLEVANRLSLDVVKHWVGRKSINISYETLKQVIESGVLCGYTMGKHYQKMKHENKTNT